MPYLLFLLIFIFISPLNGDEMKSLSKHDLTSYRFSSPPINKEVLVKQLNVSQSFILSSRRREFNALLYRNLGIMEARGDIRDLSILQQVVDQKLLANHQIKAWQSMGIVFGDILVKEFGLSWISYEDEAGSSTALQWKETDNFVFPVTFFSKRIQFGESIDVRALFNKLSTEISQFKQSSSPVAGQR